jgi:Na+/proline symporter
MDAQSMGDAMARGLTGLVIFVAVMSAVLAGLLVFSVMALTQPSLKDVIREQERQAIIETLTPEQRKGLGL